MRSLVLDEGDGRLFERIYAIACQLANPAKAKALRAEYEGSPRFWQTAFNEMNGGDMALVSAILQAVGAPFGAYALTEKAPDKLAITPWLYSDEKRLNEAFDKVAGGDAAQLYSVSRSISLTADFLTWLKEYTNSAKRG